MNDSVLVWVVIAASAVAANLPFLSQRLLLCLPRAQPKSLGLRLLELLLYYVLAGGLGLLLEQRAGQIAAQGWEFYAITGALFVTLAFPGFVYRYLLKHPH
ncbi:MAG: DUF2818 family protein [Burkholderiaceae bacterium]